MCVCEKLIICDVEVKVLPDLYSEESCAFSRIQIWSWVWNLNLGLRFIFYPSVLIWVISLLYPTSVNHCWLPYDLSFESKYIIESRQFEGCLLVRTKYSFLCCCHRYIASKRDVKPLFTIAVLWIFITNLHVQYC